jgi:hypothetical protein
MAQIELDDAVLAAATQKATDGGYASVEAYIADIVIQDDCVGDTGKEPNLDHLFTAELLAEIDEADAEIDTGHFFTTDQVDQYLSQEREKWLQQSGNR